MSTDGPMESRHVRAGEAFVDRVRSREPDGIEALYLFGSTARGEEAGLASDVDFLAVVSDTTHRGALRAELEDVAYDVMLEFGPVVEVHVLSKSTFETRRERGHPFIQHVLEEGRSFV